MLAVLGENLHAVHAGGHDELAVVVDLDREDGVVEVAAREELLVVHEVDAAVSERHGVVVVIGQLAGESLKF